MPVESMYADTVPVLSRDRLMSSAQAAIRRFCGWHVAPVITETITLDSAGGRVLQLPSGRVADVSSVVVLGHDITGVVQWSQDGLLVNPAGFPDHLRGVEVTLTHGWDPEDVPEVVDLVGRLADRAMMGAQAGIAVSQSAGGMSVRNSTNRDGQVIGMDLMSSDQDLLRQYCITRQVSL